MGSRRICEMTFCKSISLLRIWFHSKPRHHSVESERSCIRRLDGTKLMPYTDEGLYSTCIYQSQNHRGSENLASWMSIN